MPMGGRRPRSLAGERGWLFARLADVPDLTLRGLVVELDERGVVTSYGSVCQSAFRRRMTAAATRGEVPPAFQNVAGESKAFEGVIIGPGRNHHRGSQDALQGHGFDDLDRGFVWFYREEKLSVPVRSPIGLLPPALRAASRARTPGNFGRSKRLVMKRRIEVVSYCV
jgi:hypothetical protein